jgi:hypothetical protein
MKNKVVTYGAPVFLPDYSAIVLPAKMCTNSHEHSMYTRFLLYNYRQKRKKQKRYLWSTCFVPDKSATILVAEMCTNSHEPSI